MKYIILSNKLKCKCCGDIIESVSRHDFVSCTCGNAICDGGKDYLRRLGNPENYIDLSEVTSEEEEEDWFEKIRSTFTWSSRGKSGDEPLHHILLKDMSTEHLENVLKTQYHIKGTYVEDWFKMELEYRNKEQL